MVRGPAGAIVRGLSAISTRRDILRGHGTSIESRESFSEERIEKGDGRRGSGGGFSCGTTARGARGRSRRGPWQREGCFVHPPLPDTRAGCRGGRVPKEP